MIGLYDKIPLYKNPKGKAQPSFTIVNGKTIPYWITKHNGYENVNKKINEYIDKGYDYVYIGYLLGVTTATIRTYIKNNIPHRKTELDKISKIVSSKRRSKACSGIPKPTKGKTYKEIYGTHNPGCGFKKGNDNPNFTRPKFVGCTCIDKYGNKRRSKYEVEFGELLTENGIDYAYENHYNLNNGTVKIVDFEVNGNLIEVTGYAYEEWRNDFDAKIQLLAKTYPDKKIYIISKNYCNKTDIIKMLKDKHESEQIKILELDNHCDIIKSLGK